MITPLLTSLAVSTPEAAACGGFACDQGQPVLQAAERIVFGMHEARGEVEMHVQITYEGPSDDFAWIVPVPAEPYLSLTTSNLFANLALATRPTFPLVATTEGYCGPLVEVRFGYENSMQALPGAQFGSVGDEGGTVNLVSQQTVGPYDTVTLSADSATGLLDWLQDAGYDLPDGLEDVLAPYVARDAMFVALKLTAGADTGDLAPLALRYRAEKAVVPVQLTSISATPDLRMEVYVLSEGRGVPESYLHVRINEAALDWWSFGSNYDDVITQAANEAGGHAFATDFHGALPAMGPLWDEASWDEDALRRAPDRETWGELLRSSLVAVPPELFPVLDDALGVPTGQGQTWWTCPDCIALPTTPFDAGIATDLVVERVVEPLRADQSLLDRFPRVSRMTSSLDADEMTVDPVFVVNHDLAHDDVSSVHTAELITDCGNGRRREKAPRRLVLSDGREIHLPSERWFRTQGLTEFEYISELGDTKAQVIEQMGAEGPPVVLTDHTDDLFALVDAHNRALACGGCASTGSGAASGFGGALALVVVRRRRR